MSQTGPPFFVPPGGVIELLAGLVLRPKRLFHRFVRFASVRRRTSSQAVPFDSPRRTLRARRSISAAHAASTSACSSGAASRLSSSSTATLARSSGPSFRASSRTCLTSAMDATLSSRPVTANPAAAADAVGFAAVAAEPPAVRRLYKSRRAGALGCQTYMSDIYLASWHPRILLRAALALIGTMGILRRTGNFIAYRFGRLKRSFSMNRWLSRPTGSTRFRSLAILPLAKRKLAVGSSSALPFGASSFELSRRGT